MTSNNQTAPSNPTIFVDLGGIFVHYPADHALKTGDTALPLGRVLSSSPWMDYEVGKLTEQECFARVADLFGVDAKNLEAVVLKLRATLPFASRMVSVFRAVKETPGVKVQVVLTTNISQEEYRALRGRWDEAFWSIFDHVVTSGEVGVRKPSLQFYRHALRVAGSSPQHSLVVDDRPENVLAAMSLGMRGHVGTDSIARVLANFVGDPVERGLAFLRKNAGKLYSTTEDGDPIEENYAQLLVLEALNDRTLVDLQRPPGLWNFFSGKPKYTSQRYPDDFDTTSLALVAMEYEPEAAHPILDEMLKHVNEDGLVPIYFDKSRPRVDAVIALNTLVAFGKYGRGNELPETLSWIEQILLHRAYIYGTRYYPSPEWFLYYMSRLLTHAKDPALNERFGALLKSRLVERVGAAGDAFCLGMRLLACHSLGIHNHPDRERLASIQ